MNKKHNTHTIFVASLTLLTTIALTACSGTGPSGGPDTLTPAASASCTSTKPTVTADTPTVAILGQVGPQLSSFRQDIDMVVDTAATEKAHIIVNGVSADGSAPDLLSNVVLTGEGNNNLERTKDLACKKAAVTNAVATLQKGTLAKQPNAFDAISALAGNLDHNPSKQPIDVVLLTPLSAKAGDIDLSKPGTLDDPVGAVNSLAKKGLIPDCTNYRFYAVSPDTGMNDADAAKLREFWLLYAQKCGGEFVAWTDHLATFPVTSAITPTDYSQIKVDRTQQTVTATLGADVLFGADSAALQETATPALNQLRDLATQYTGKIIITGYVNPVEPGTNSPGDRALSQQRAQAVASWLVTHGIAEDRITTVGNGTAEAVYPNPTSDAQRAANRRVVAVIYTQDA
jgi:outer membrane protein OmpA-like peptidoglycan-associated protein